MIKGMVVGAAALLAGSGAALAAMAADPQPARRTQDLYHWFTADDYPLAALRRYAEGAVGFRLTIDAQGMVSACVVESSSGDLDLDRVTCEILRSRPRYYPARDAAGRAVEGSDTGRVTWRLPPEQQPPAPLALATVDLEGMIRMNGPQLACRTTVNGRSDGPTVVPMCSLLVSAEGATVLRRSVPGTEFSAVLSIRLAGATRSAPTAGAAPLFTAAATVTVRADGSVGACAPLGTPARLPTGFTSLHGPCALFPPGARKHFAGDPAQTQPRSARLELHYYLRPHQQLGPPVPPLAMQAPARANLASYFSADDFPEPARLRQAQGTVGFRLAISAEGRVTDCIVTLSSGDSSLDETTCAIIRERARYAPARDAEQRPVAGTDQGRVTWQYPPGYERASLAPYRLVTRLRRTADGGLRCTIVENGVPLPGETRGECGDLMGFGAEAWMRRPGGPSEITYVFARGRADGAIDAPGADEAGYGRLAAEAITSLSIAQSGRIADCRPIRRVQPLTLGMDGLGDCDLMDSDEAPHFEAAADPLPRRARMRTAIFIR
ncbi:MAG TPA: energy transducer TonB [Allosphingosinicella sp.]|nr:energy transducer TonB [Allosphingosinicella sp.]